MSNQESLRLQYALQRRAKELGWREADIDVIDSDLGLSGASAAQHSGFKELVGRVGLNEVGLILSIDVTRLFSTACSAPVAASHSRAAATQRLFSGSRAAGLNRLQPTSPTHRFC